MNSRITPESTGRQSCPLCHCAHHSPRFHDAGVQVVACDRCELLYITPYPESPESIYQTVSDYDYDHLTILSPERHYAASQALYEETFSLIFSHIQGASSVLDVGCGTGHLLERLGKEHRLHRVGLELNKSRAEFARGVAACEIREQPLEMLDDHEKFDVLLLMDVIAHVPNLRYFLSRVRGQLTTGGKIIMRVGEYSSAAQAKTHFDWQIPDHLQFFGLKTAEFMALEFGLNIVEHIRIPLASEIFSRRAWSAEGRSGIRNGIKKLVVATPGLLSVMRAIYASTAGRGHFASLIIFRENGEGIPNNEQA